MNLEPEISAFIRLSESLYTTGVDATVQNQRDVYETVAQHFTPPHPPALSNRYERIDGVPVRWYWRKDTDDSAPCIVFLHGGGFVVGSLESHDFFCARLANDSHCKVIAIDYRLVPEHPYPAAFDDCRAVLNALQHSPDQYGIDEDKIILCGDSAGGNLVAALTLLNRDENNAALLGQIGIYPWLAAGFELPSYRECSHAPMLSTDDMRYYRRVYLGKNGKDSPYNAPLLARDFSNLPPALLFPVEYDPLRDDAYDYHEKLTSAACHSSLVLGKGLVHGCLRAIDTSPGVQLIYQEILKFINRLVKPS